MAVALVCAISESGRTSRYFSADAVFRCCQTRQAMPLVIGLYRSNRCNTPAPNAPHPPPELNSFRPNTNSLCFLFNFFSTNFQYNSRSTTMMPIVSSLSAVDDDIATEEEPADFLLSAGELDDSEDESVEDPVPARFISAQRIADLRVTHRRHETDCGSPEFQVAGMTERISHLTSHLKEHPKDFSTRRGLVALVNKRRRLLNYLFKQDQQAYVDIVAALGIRHKVPGSIPSKEDQYGRFPNAKPSKGKSKVKTAKANARK